LSKKHGKFDGIQICCGNFQTASTDTQLNVRFCGAVEVRTSGQSQIMFQGYGTEFSAFMLIVGRMEAFQS
jgi:hypothetical protein